MLKDITFTKFDASVDVDIRLGVDLRSLTKWCVVLCLCHMA